MGRMNEPLCYNNIFQGTWGVACERADEWEGSGGIGALGGLWEGGVTQQSRKLNFGEHTYDLTTCLDANCMWEDIEKSCPFFSSYYSLTL